MMVVSGDKKDLSCPIPALVITTGNTNQTKVQKTRTIDSNSSSVFKSIKSMVSPYYFQNRFLDVDLLFMRIICYVKLSKG